MMRGTPPRMLWHGWEKPSGRAAVGAEARALGLIFLCALTWAGEPVCYVALPMALAAEMLWWRFCLRYRTLGCANVWLEHLAAGAALIRLSVPMQRWAGYLPRAVPLGAALVALWLYMDIRHARKGFRAWLHRALAAVAVMFFALAWTLRAGILTEQMTM